MRGKDVLIGHIVRVLALRNTTGMLCGPEHLANRRAPVMGKVIACEPCDEDEGTVLVWVKHGKTEAPYWNYELDLVGERTR